MEPHHTIFVYGTLKKGHHNHFLLGDSKYVGNAVLKGYKMYDMGGYPCIKPSDKLDHLIQGEIYHVTDARVLDKLDYLEGHPRFYRRTEMLSDKGIVEVYMYQSEVLPHMKQITEGVWR